MWKGNELTDTGQDRRSQTGPEQAPHQAPCQAARPKLIDTHWPLAVHVLQVRDLGRGTPFSEHECLWARAKSILQGQALP